MLRIGLLTGLSFVNSQGSEVCQPNKSPAAKVSMIIKTGSESRYLRQLQGPENARQDVCTNY